jgi:Ca2+-binding RTX toxin-like protein
MLRLVVAGFLIAMLAVPAVSAPTFAAAPKCHGQTATIVGTADADLLKGTAGSDVIVAGDGNDRIVAGGGIDVVCGGTGDDTLLGGAGRDRLFGDDGNDLLKGGAAADALNGGLGVDGCYPGAGGASVVACEDADLAVSIQAASQVTDDQPFSYTVKVRNVGGRTSGAYDLLIDQALTNVTCGYTPPASTPFSALKSRGFDTFTVNMSDGCSINESATEWHLDIHASVSGGGVDANHANDSADARIDIVPVVP